MHQKVMGKVHFSQAKTGHEISQGASAVLSSPAPGAGPAVGSCMDVTGRQSLPFRKTTLGEAACISRGSQRRLSASVWGGFLVQLVKGSWEPRGWCGTQGKKEQH